MSLHKELNSVSFFNISPCSKYVILNNRLYDLHNDKYIKYIDDLLRDRFNAHIYFSPYGQYLLYYLDKTLELLEIDTWISIKTLKLDYYIMRHAFSRNNKYLLLYLTCSMSYGGKTNYYYLCNLQTHTCEILYNTQSLLMDRFTPDSKCIIRSSEHNKFIRLFDISNRTYLDNHLFTDLEGVLCSDKYLIGICDKTIKLFDVNTYQLINQFKYEEKSIICLYSISNNSKYLITKHFEKCKLWDLDNCKLKHEFMSCNTSMVEINASNKYIAYLDGHHGVKLIDLENMMDIKDVCKYEPNNYYFSLKFSSDDNYLIIKTKLSIKIFHTLKFINEQKVTFLLGSKYKESTINKYTNNFLYDHNLDKLIFSYL